MKIAHVGPSILPIPHDRGGAVQRRMVELAAEQVRLGHEVALFSPEASEGRAFHRGVVIERVKVRLPRPWRDYEFLRQTYRRLRETPVDLIHFHGVPEGARVARRLGCRSALSFDFFRFRLSRSPAGKAYLRRSLKNFDLLLPVSRACARLATEYWGPLPFDVLPNGVNLEQFHPDHRARRSFRDEMGVGDDECVVLYVGRLCEQKGTDTLLEAWNQLEEKSAKLVMAGPVGQFGCDEESPLVDRLRGLGGTYLGAVDEGSLAAVYNGCDIFVMPTRSDEMFGMAALEAQACGKPVIASDWGGLVESVSADAGRFFQPGDARLLASSLQSLIQEEESRRTMGTAAQEHAKRFGWASVARRSVALYQKVTDPGSDDVGLMEQLLESYVSPSETLWRFAELRAVQGLQLGRPILEIGCGDGTFTGLALSRVDQAIDLNPHAVERASRRPDVYATVQVGDARMLPAADGSVETVFANCVLEHVPEIDLVLKECARVLGPSGRFVATVPLEEMNRHLVFGARRYAQWRQRALVHHNLWSVEEWTRRLQAVGFDDVEATPYLLGPLCKLWDRLDAPLMIGVGRVKLGVLIRRIPRVLPSAVRRALRARTSKALAAAVAKRNSSGAPCAVLLVASKGPAGRGEA